MAGMEKSGQGGPSFLHVLGILVAVAGLVGTIVQYNMEKNSRERAFNSPSKRYVETHPTIEFTTPVLNTELHGDTVYMSGTFRDPLGALVQDNMWVVAIDQSVEVVAAVPLTFHDIGIWEADMPLSRAGKHVLKIVQVKDSKLMTNGLPDTDRKLFGLLLQQADKYASSVVIMQ